jgi:hypothetical protein
MNLVPINIHLVDNNNQEQQLLHIENLIDVKRKMLLEKQKKIRKISKQNEFLDEIREDYGKYYGYIIQQKKDQMDALDLLNKYIHDLTVSGKLSKNNVEDAKYEQKKILSEIKSIKHNLDNIIKDTDDVGSILKQKNVI